ncbi:MAG: zinc ABC transporter substrate-binding protein [Spirochaetaceae bacterium]|nr:zinc ABC transporter substrate-binding protein [Spirochaetaceae bacterium]MCF7948758.1 zinc ABC transporter substrate-binding protein [Spirochaetia bacterium]MCF7951924.1 zinc ABC transporter substrate-binding protein [Spirochaetaceae bacterium]
MKCSASPQVPLGALLIVFLLLLAPPLYSAGSSEQEGGNESDPALTVFVSILPQRYFVEQIGGSSVEVNVMVPPGKSPATYEPSPKQVFKLGRAELFFTIGVPFEQAFIPLIKDEMKSLRIIDTSRGIEKRSIHADEALENNEQTDPHIWLAPPLVEVQAAHIRDGLIEVNPEKESLYRRNYQSFVKELQTLDNDLRQILEPVKGSTILVYHPSFGYFAETYGLSQMAIEMGGKEPSARQLQEVIATAKKHDAKVLFVQPEFSKASAEKVAKAIDGAVVEVAPLNPEYMKNMRSIAQSIREGYQNGE